MVNSKDRRCQGTQMIMNNLDAELRAQNMRLRVSTPLILNPCAVTFGVDLYVTISVPVFGGDDLDK